MTTDTPHNPPHRSIKSYVLRQGHMTAAQQKAIDDNWASIGIDFQAAPLDLTAAFRRANPKVLEIGFGMGVATAQIAQRLPETDFLAKLLPKLKSGGYIHLATDWEEYAQQMLEVLQSFPDALANTAVDFAPTPAYRPETKFEARGKRLGHGVWDLVFRKK